VSRAPGARAVTFTLFFGGPQVQDDSGHVISQLPPHPPFPSLPVSTEELGNLGPPGRARL